MIPEVAKRFVEQIGFDEKSKSLLSDCFVHRCHVIHLLRRDYSSLTERSATKTGANSPESLPDVRTDKRQFLMRTKQWSKNGMKSRTFTKHICNCLIGREIYNRAGLIILS